MTSKERVALAVSHKTPDRTPAFLGRIDDQEHWFSAYNVASQDELRSFFQLDLRKMSYDGVFRVDEGCNVWGAAGAYEAGYSTSRGGFPLAQALSVADVEAHAWPTLERLDLAKFTARVDAMSGEYPQILSFGTLIPFDTLLDLFGMENAMVLMHESPEMIDAAIARIEAFFLEALQAVLEANAHKAQYFWIGDDFSTQRGMMISPDMWRRFIKPVYAKVFERIHAHGLDVWFHSCGTFRPVMGDLIDIGMNVWETVQAHLAGNEPEQLKREFGRHITFFGAINCQQTLPFGTPDDVRREVRERIRVLGKGGGYICGPDHSIQANMPPENLLALYDEIRKCEVS